MKAKFINLNDRLPKSRSETLHHDHISVRFGSLRPWLVDTIGTAARVEGCVAWLTDPVILRALRKVHADLVVTSDKMHTKKRFQGLASVRRVGRQRGRLRPLLHHKFLIGLSKSAAPLWVLTGSMNFSTHSAHNLENAVLIRDPAVVETFRAEFRRVRKISRSI